MVNTDSKDYEYLYNKYKSKYVHLSNKMRGGGLKSMTSGDVTTLSDFINNINTSPNNIFELILPSTYEDEILECESYIYQITTKIELLSKMIEVITISPNEDNIIYDRIASNNNIIAFKIKLSVHLKYITDAKLVILKYTKDINDINKELDLKNINIEFDDETNSNDIRANKADLLTSQLAAYRVKQAAELKVICTTAYTDWENIVSEKTKWGNINDNLKAQLVVLENKMTDNRTDIDNRKLRELKYQLREYRLKIVSLEHEIADAAYFIKIVTEPLTDNITTYTSYNKIYCIKYNTYTDTILDGDAYECNYDDKKYLLRLQFFSFEHTLKQSAIELMESKYTQTLAKYNPDTSASNACDTIRKYVEISSAFTRKKICFLTPEKVKDIFENYNMTYHLKSTTIPTFNCEHPETLTEKRSELFKSYSYMYSKNTPDPSMIYDKSKLSIRTEEYNDALAISIDKDIYIHCSNVLKYALPNDPDSEEPVDPLNYIYGIYLLYCSYYYYKRYTKNEFMKLCI